MDNFKVDMKEYANQYADIAKEDGITCEIFIHNIEPEDFMQKDGSSLATPLCQIKGKGSPVNLAILAKTMRKFADHLLQDKDVKTADMVLNMTTSQGKTLRVEGEKHDKN